MCCNHYCLEINTIYVTVVMFIASRVEHKSYYHGNDACVITVHADSYFSLNSRKPDCTRSWTIDIFIIFECIIK